MADFNLSAELQIQNVIGIRQAVTQVESAFKNAKIDVSVNISGTSLRSLDDLNSRISAIQNNIKGLIATSTTASSALSGIGGRAASGLDSMSRSSQGASGSLGGVRASASSASKELHGFADNIGLTTRRFLAFTVGAGAVIAAFQGIRAGVSGALEFERAMVRLAQVSGETPAAIRAVQDEVTRLSTSLGISSRELVEQAIVLKQAGLSAQETKQALQAIGQASLAPNFGNMKEITEGAIAVLRQFDKETVNLSTHLGAMNEVAGAFAVEASDLVEVTRRAGGSFTTAGGNLNELLALFTSVRSTTRESADSISTGLRTIFSRLQRSDTVEALKEFQVNLRHTSEEAERLGDTGLTGQFVGAYEAIRRVSEGLAGLRTTDARYTGIVDQLGGTRNISRVIPLLQQQGEAQRALNVAQTGNISLQIAAERAQDSLLVKTQGVKEEYLALFRAITESSGFQSLAKNALLFASGLEKVLEFAKPLVPLMVTLATIKLFRSLPDAYSAVSGRLAYGEAPKKMARGGVVTGGRPNEDSVPALLMPGEFVLPKDAAQRVGYGNLQRFSNGNRVDAGKRSFESVFKVPYSDSNAKNIFGFPDDPEISINSSPGLVHGDLDQGLAINFQKYGQSGFSADRTARRLFNKKQNVEKLIVRNESFQVINTGQGLGSEIFYNQVRALRTLKADRIDTNAVGNNHNLNGYYTWPRLGYDGDIPSNYRNGHDDYIQLPEKLKSAKTIQDLFKIPGGPEWWKEHGSDLDLSFDLKDGSRSLEALKAYRLSKKQSIVGLVTGGRASLSGGGGLTRLSSRNAMSHEDITIQVLGKSTRRDYASLLLAGIRETEANRFVPKGSEFIGNGIAALAFKSPEGDVLRLQPYIGQRPFESDKNSKGQQFSPSLFNYRRPNTDAVLQNTGADLTGNTLVERLPYVPSIQSVLGEEKGHFLANHSPQVAKLLQAKLLASGLFYPDMHTGNVELQGGAPKILDVGSPMGRFEAAKLKLGYSVGASDKDLVDKVLNDFTTWSKEDGSLTANFRKKLRFENGGRVGFSDGSKADLYKLLVSNLYNQIGKTYNLDLSKTVSGVGIVNTKGKISDVAQGSFNPKSKIIKLSPDRFEKPDSSLVFTAAHELGHAIDFQNENLRMDIVKKHRPLVLDVNKNSPNLNVLSHQFEVSADAYASLFTGSMFQGASKPGDKHQYVSPKELAGVREYLFKEIIPQIRANIGSYKGDINFPSIANIGGFDKELVDSSSIPQSSPLPAQNNPLSKFQELKNKLYGTRTLLEQRIDEHRKLKPGGIEGVEEFRYHDIIHDSNRPIAESMLAELSKLKAPELKQFAKYLEHNEGEKGGPVFTTYTKEQILETLRRKLLAIEIAEKSIRYSGGGRVGFANGGAAGWVVPGMGNTDSFPADLPVGSYVIRKKSAERIGHENLARMANGGEAKPRVPALLMPGEFVFNPDAAARVGAAKLHTINTQGYTPYAQGGRVGYATGKKVTLSDLKGIAKEHGMTGLSSYGKDELLSSLATKASSDEEIMNKLIKAVGLDKIKETIFNNLISIYQRREAISTPGNPEISQANATQQLNDYISKVTSKFSGLGNETKQQGGSDIKAALPVVSKLPSETPTRNSAASDVPAPISSFGDVKVGFTPLSGDFRLEGFPRQQNQQLYSQIEQELRLFTENAVHRIQKIKSVILTINEKGEAIYKAVELLTKVKLVDGELIQPRASEYSGQKQLQKPGAKDNIRKSSEFYKTNPSLDLIKNTLLTKLESSHSFGVLKEYSPNAAEEYRDRAAVQAAVHFQDEKIKPKKNESDEKARERVFKGFLLNAIRDQVTTNYVRSKTGIAIGKAPGVEPTGTFGLEIDTISKQGGKGDDYTKQSKPIGEGLPSSAAEAAALINETNAINIRDAELVKATNEAKRVRREIEAGKSESPKVEQVGNGARALQLIRINRLMKQGKSAEEARAMVSGQAQATPVDAATAVPSALTTVATNQVSLASTLTVASATMQQAATTLSSAQRSTERTAELVAAHAAAKTVGSLPPGPPPPPFVVASSPSGDDGRLPSSQGATRKVFLIHSEASARNAGLGSSFDLSTPSSQPVQAVEDQNQIADAMRRRRLWAQEKNKVDPSKINVPVPTDDEKTRLFNQRIEKELRDKGVDPNSVGTPTPVLGGFNRPTRQEVVVDLRQRKIHKDSEIAERQKVFEQNKFDTDSGAVHIDKLISGRASLLAAKRVEAQGGVGVLAPSTVAKIYSQAREEEEIKVKRELLDGERKAVRAQNPLLKAGEDLKIAHDNLARAEAGLEKVIVAETGGFNKSGKAILATSTTANAVTQAGGSIDKPGFFRRGYDYVNDKARSLKEKFFAPTEDGGISPIGLGLQLSLPYVSAGIEHLGGDAEIAAKSGNTGGFLAARGASGAVNAGTIGAVIAGTGTSALASTSFAAGVGPWAPIIIGIAAAGGAIYGLVSSLREADKEIRQVKINEAMTIFSDRLQVLSNLGSTASGQVRIDALNNLGTLRREGDERARKSLGFFTGNDTRAFLTEQSRGQRQDFGGQLAGMIQFLSKEAEELGKTNIGRSLNDLEAVLRNGSDGLNKEFIQILSDVRNVSKESIYKDLRKSIEAGQRQEQIRVDARRASRADVNLSTLGRLETSARSAIDDVGTQQTLFRAGLDGNSPVPVSFGVHRLSNLNQAGDNPGLQNTLGLIGRLFGSQGQAAGRIVNTASRVSSVLPDVLIQARGQGAIGETAGDFVSRTRSLLTARLGGAENVRQDEQLTHAINDVIHGLNRLTENGLENLNNALTTDSSALSESLVSRFTQPVQRAAQALQLFSDQQNQFVTNLQSLNQEIVRAAEFANRAVSAQISVRRTEANFSDYNTFATRGSTIRDIPIADLTADVQHRQEQLTGRTGADARNPALIGTLINDARREETRLITRQSTEVYQNGNVTQTAEQLNTVRLRMQNYVRALETMTDATRQNAAITERLNVIEAERQGRLSYATRFATGSPEQRMEMNNGVFALIRAVAQGNLDGLSERDLRGAHETSQQFGNVSLPLFGGRDGATVWNQLTRNTPGLAPLINGPRGEASEVQNLQSRVVENERNAAEANRVLGTVISDNVTRLTNDLRTMQTQFFAQLNQHLGRGETQALETRASSLINDRVNLNNEATYAQNLGRIGVRTNTQYTSAQSLRGSFTSLFDTDEALNRAREVRSSLTRRSIPGELNENGVPIVSGFDNIVNEFGNNRGVTNENYAIRRSLTTFLDRNEYRFLRPEQRTGIINRTIESANDDLVSHPINRNDRSPERLRDVIRPYFERAVNTELDVRTPRTVLNTTYQANRAAEQTLVNGNINVSEVRAVGRAPIEAALTAFGSNNSLESLPTRLRTFNDAVQDVTDALVDARIRLVRSGVTPGPTNLENPALSEIPIIPPQAAVAAAPPQINPNSPIGQLLGPLVSRPLARPGQDAQYSWWREFLSGAGTGVENIFRGNGWGRATGGLVGRFNTGGHVGRVGTSPVGFNGEKPDSSVFSPVGTDTVPALLPNGSFVIKRSMAEKHRELLDSLTSNYDSGGSVVKAMLTPGEHVVSPSVARHNLAALHAINNGQMPRFAKGGAVYLQFGGLGNVIGRGVDFLGVNGQEALNREMRRRQREAHNDGPGNINRLIPEPFVGPPEPPVVLPIINPVGPRPAPNPGENIIAGINRQFDADRRNDLLGLNGPEARARAVAFRDRQWEQERIRDNEQRAFNIQADSDPFSPTAALRAGENARDILMHRIRNRAITPADIAAQEQARDAAIEQNTISGQISGLRDRQLEAQTVNPFARFGLSRADSSTQTSLNLNTLQSGQRISDNFKNKSFILELARSQREQNNRRQWESLGNGIQNFFGFGRANGGLIGNFAEGGHVPGNPFGPEDTQLAMLSPGEYVLPRRTVSQVGTGALDRLRRYAEGGVVGNGLSANARGVNALSVNGLSGNAINPDIMQQLTSAMGTFSSSSVSLIGALSSFSQNVQTFARAMESFPSKLNITGHQTHEVIFNGAEVFSSMTGEIKQLIEEKTKEVVRQVFRDNLPAIGVSLD